MAKETIKKVERIVNYYELKIKFKEGNNFDSFFKTITKLAKTRAKIRYQRFGDKYIFLQGVDNKEGLLKGKIRCIRMDLLPELMNLKTDETKGIEVKEQEGLVETTHFIIDYRKSKILLALEYNHQGSKIVDFVYYVERIGLHKDIVTNVGYAPIVKDNLKQLKSRIKRFSEFVVKIHKDNVPKIKEMDTKIWQALDASITNFDSDYATLKLKYNYKQRTEMPKIEKSVFNIINHFSKNNKDKHLFNTLSIRAEDQEKNDLLETFDLLIEKTNSKIKVQKKPKYKTIISEHMFHLITIELNRIDFI